MIVGILRLSVESWEEFFSHQVSGFKRNPTRCSKSSERRGVTELPKASIPGLESREEFYLKGMTNKVETLDTGRVLRLTCRYGRPRRRTAEGKPQEASACLIR